MRRMRVRVPVSTLWAAPDAPRPVDTPAVAETPDLAGWLAAMDEQASDDDGRAGLQGRVHSQLLQGEPVLAVADGANNGAGWVEVVCPWQPSSRDPRGYPGWVPEGHLERDDRDEEPAPRAETLLDVPPGECADLIAARRYLELPYLWGGTSPLGLDCSGLVHLVQRTLGTVVPRDAHDQQRACDPLDPEAAQPGDLYFFAEPGQDASHVGIVTGAYRMIHASGAVGVVEGPLREGRLATPSGAGRIRRETR